MAENENKSIEELLDDNLGKLSSDWVSVDLTPSNANLYRSEGGLISLKLTLADGSEKYFERVVILRAFPFSNPEEFLSVKEVSPHKTERGREIGMIRYLNKFDEETVKVVREELDRRYFIPEIYKIRSVKERMGYYYWNVETSAGDTIMLIGDPYSDVRVMDDGSVRIAARDGSHFIIPDPAKFDPASLKKIEMYL